MKTVTSVAAPALTASVVTLSAPASAMQDEGLEFFFGGSAANYVTFDHSHTVSAQSAALNKQTTDADQNDRSADD